MKMLKTRAKQVTLPPLLMFSPGPDGGQHMNSRFHQSYSPDLKWINGTNWRSSVSMLFKHIDIVTQVILIFLLVQQPPPPPPVSINNEECSIANKIGAGINEKARMWCRVFVTHKLCRFIACGWESYQMEKHFILLIFQLQWVQKFYWCNHQAHYILRL